MNSLERYLEFLNKNESIFPMDSVHTGQPLSKKIYSQRINEDTVEKKETLLIDLDGTIHNYSKGWHDGTIYDGPKEGAKEAIDKLKDEYEIVIFTTRASEEANGDDTDNQVKSVKNWLNKHKIYFDRITAEKIPCYKIIDDLAITFTNWKDVINKIEDSKNLY